MQELTVGSQAKCNVKLKKPEPRVHTRYDKGGALTTSATTTSERDGFSNENLDAIKKREAI